MFQITAGLDNFSFILTFYQTLIARNNTSTRTFTELDSRDRNIVQYNYISCRTPGDLKTLCSGVLSHNKDQQWLENDFCIGF